MNGHFFLNLKSMLFNGLYHLLLSRSIILSSAATFDERLHNEDMVDMTIMGEIDISSSNEDFKIHPIDNNNCGDDSKIASCIQLYYVIF